MTYFWVGAFGVFKSSSRRIAVVTVYTSTAHQNLLFRSECSTQKSVIQVLVHGLLVHHHSICYAWLALTRGMFGQHELLRVGGCQFTRPLGNIYNCSSSILGCRTTTQLRCMGGRVLGRLERNVTTQLK